MGPTKKTLLRMTAVAAILVLATCGLGLTVLAQQQDEATGSVTITLLPKDGSEGGGGSGGGSSGGDRGSYKRPGGTPPPTFGKAEEERPPTVTIVQKDVPATNLGTLPKTGSSRMAGATLLAAGLVLTGWAATAGLHHGEDRA